MSLQRIEEGERARERKSEQEQKQRYQLPMKLNDNDDINETCLCVFQHSLSSIHFHGVYQMIVRATVHWANLVVGIEQQTRSTEVDTQHKSNKPCTFNLDRNKSTWNNTCMHGCVCDGECKLCLVLLAYPSFIHPSKSKQSKTLSTMPFLTFFDRQFFSLEAKW